ncbi:MAG: glycoside hydrolase family 1 protein [Thermotogaceae bacterium]|nr:glycoside hydrolase family 1 protein [Thermotogaceae bacterium]
MFPKNFFFGVSLSGFQFEMGGKDAVDDKSDWFLWVRDPVNISSGLVSGDLPEDGPDYWNRYKEDNEIIKDLNMNAVRIGIEWSRIFPTSTTDIDVDVKRNGDSITEVTIDKVALEKLRKRANKDAIKRYRQIMEDIKSKGLHLIVNLNHFTLPIWLHNPLEVRRYGVENSKKSGWFNSEAVVEFAKYAAVVAAEFGDLVDEWSTMNEPQVVSSLGYIQVKAGFPPAYPSFEAFVKTMVNQAQAHARAYDVIKSITSKPVGLIYSFSPVYPADSESAKAVEKAMYFQNYWFMDMITFGKIGKIFENSEEVREDMGRKLDFIGVNYYTRMVVKSVDSFPGWQVLGGYGYGCAPSSKSLDGYLTSEFGWEVYPRGLYDISKAIYDRYGLSMIVTENGIADSTDSIRSYFIVAHLKYLGKALKDGIDVKGYLHWSLIDNYEWAQGFSKKFGLVYVDLKTKKRCLRPSAIVFSKIIEERSVNKFESSVPY